ncbi:MAG: hypothetical protein ABII82_18180 [Verrucomicrobiota bacterium]
MARYRIGDRVFVLGQLALVVRVATSFQPRLTGYGLRFADGTEVVSDETSLSAAGPAAAPSLRLVCLDGERLAP